MEEEHPSLHSFVYSEAVVGLVRAANEAASFMEDLKSVEAREFILRSLELLAPVYAGMLAMEDTEPVFDSPGEPTVTEQDWSAVYQQIARLLGAHNEFLRPAEEGEFDRSEVVRHTVSEDLADVYQELRDFTSLYSRGMEELMNDAAWELKERFTEHWGRKLLRAMAALHDLYAAGTDPSEE